MTKSTIVKTKQVKSGYVVVKSVSLDNPFVNLLDRIGLGNDDAVGNSFETMVFECNEKGKVVNWDELDKDNYKTEKEALLGHQKMVKKWKKLKVV
jgi:uncharacterized protein YfkK (UPF0435 family)